MSQQNIKDWQDRTGKILDIGQRIVAIKGKNLHVGEILWFTKSGVTIASENLQGETVATSIGFYNNNQVRSNVLILS